MKEKPWLQRRTGILCSHVWVTWLSFSSQVRTYRGYHQYCGWNGRSGTPVVFLYHMTHGVESAEGRRALAGLIPQSLSKECSTVVTLQAHHRVTLQTHQYRLQITSWDPNGGWIGRNQTSPLSWRQSKRIFHCQLDTTK